MRRGGSFARHGLVVLACAVLPACGHFRGGKVAPPQVVDMDPDVLRTFQREVEEYVRLHQELLERVPNVSESATAAEMDAHRKKMGDAIRAERRRAKQGDIFKPRVAAAFAETIRKELSGPEGAAMLQELASGNPRVEGTPRQGDPSREDRRNVALAVNLAYPNGLPSSSVPSSLLLALPRLPEQVRYGFVGRALVLRETEADLILDFIRDVVPDPGLPR
jgi:hypothetical protein